MKNLTIEILKDGTEYDFQQFDCGDASLNLFLTEHLRRQHDSKILRAYVLRTAAPERRIVGYYTLSGSCFERAMLPSKTQQKRIPYKNVPSVTLGRLAIDRTLQGKGWGAVLVTHAMKVIWSASLAVGIHGMFVEAINEKAQAFYQALGFIPLSGENSHALFYPTKSIEQLFG